MGIKKFVLLTCVVGYVPFSYAAEFNWSGFLSIAGGKTLGNDVEYVVDPMSSATYDSEIRFESESLAAVQGQAVVSDNLRGTIQFVARGGKQFDAEIDWAYLSYDMTDKLTLNAGRFRLPLFFYSDSLDVGYTYHWIRPPVEVYNVPHSTLQGANLRYSTYWGDTEFESQIWYGSDYVEQDTDFGKSAFDVRNDTGANVRFTRDWLTLRAVINGLDIGFESEAFGSFEMDTTFASLALMMDFEKVFWRSEYTVLNSTVNMEGAPQSKSTDNTWYASIGSNVGNFTPHLTHAVVDGDPAGFTGQSATNTLGLSWAFHASAKFKIEYLQVDRESSMFAPASETNVLSAAIDFVF